MRPEQLASGQFVRAWSTATGEEQWVPAHFFDSPVTSRGLTREDPNPGPEPVPSERWKVADLEAYAADHDIDLTGATRKAEILAAIEAATQTQQQHDNDDHETPRAGENQE